MSLKKLSVTCLSVLFSIVPVCSSAMEGSSKTLDCKIDINNSTIDVHELPEMQGQTDDKIVNMLVDKYSEKHAFIYYSNRDPKYGIMNKLMCRFAPHDDSIYYGAPDRITLDMLFNRHREIFADPNQHHTLPNGTICVFSINDSEPFVDFDMKNMLINAEQGNQQVGKFLVIKDSKLGKKFEKALKDKQDDVPFWKILK